MNQAHDVPRVLYRDKFSWLKYFVCQIFAVFIFLIRATRGNLFPTKIGHREYWHHKLGDMVLEHEKRLCVRGCHIHQDIQEAAVAAPYIAAPYSPGSSLLVTWPFLIILVIHRRQISLCLICIGWGTLQNLSPAKITSSMVYRVPG